MMGCERRLLLQNNSPEAGSTLMSVTTKQAAALWSLSPYLKGWGKRYGSFYIQ